jgi:prevent-host-death family protein
MVRDGERGSLLCITAKEPAMEHKGVKRLPATEVKAHLGRIVHDVATTGTPVVIHTRGEDQAVIISLRDFHTLWPTAAAMSAPVRHRVRAALRAAMSLSRLWQAQGKYDAARTLLAGTYGWFTKGLDTAHLQEAKALLAALG